jgi:hypothetical protein
MMVTNARILALDEVSTGLDAAVTSSIFSSLKSICRLSGSSVVSALLQPTPETYELFDQIILLHEGRIVYHGLRTDIKRWLWRVCGLDVPVDVDEASFLVDFLADPEMAYESARLLAQTQSFVQSTRAAREQDEIAANEAEAKQPEMDGTSTPVIRQVAPLPSSNPSKNPELYDAYTTFTRQNPAEMMAGANGDGCELVDEEASRVRFHIDDEELLNGDEEESGSAAAAAAQIPHSSVESVSVADVTAPARDSEDLSSSPVPPSVRSR